MSQSIVGQIPEAVNTEIVLIGYDGFNEKELAKTITDTEGKFSFSYPREYLGAALLKINKVSNLLVLLNKENFEIQWNTIQDLNTLQFKHSPENDFFAQGIKVNQESEQKLAGLKYLLPLYKNNKAHENWLQQEINNQEQVFDQFITNLTKNSYAKDYLSHRKFLGDLQLTLERYKDLNRVKQHEVAIKKIDFTNDNLWHSGLLKDILSSYYKALELYQDEELIVQKSIEFNKIWLNALEKYPSKQQVVAEFCFTMFEQKGLTKVAEHIALSMLNNEKCELSDKHIYLFEQYRKLAIGNTAPDIIIENKKLSELKNTYKLVVFGASWCPQCQKDYPSLVGEYKKIKEKYDFEVIYISIDTDVDSYTSYFKEAPFITFCDAKGKESKPAKDYFISATPSYYLLDKELRILVKPIYPKQIIELLNRF